jgi:hypothetical protein
VTYPVLDSGELHSAFFIFVRHPHPYSDAELLARFTLGSYRRASGVALLARLAVISDDGAWTMLADDMRYTLWHMSTTRPAIEAVAKQHDVFACTEGDADRSFDFVYFKNGQLVRKYAVSSPLYSDRVVEHDFGVPLPGEAALLSKDGNNIGLDLAGTLGIKTRFAVSDLRLYIPAAGQEPG